MDEDFVELAKNIKTTLDKQEALEKSNTELVEKIKQLEIKGGRLKMPTNASQAGLAESISNAIAENAEGFKSLKEGSKTGFSFETKAVQDMTFSSVASSASATITQVQSGIVQIPPRPVHLREVFPQHSLATSSLAFLKETSVDGGISAVREGSTKPQLSMNLSEVSTKAQVLAGWVRISNQMMDDIGYLQSYLSYRLSENLLVKEDDEILNGDGNDPNLSGILLAANHTAKTGSATIFVEKLVQAIGQLAGYGRRASAIIVNPADFHDMMILKADTSGDYTNPVVVQITPSGGVTLLGVPIIWSAAINSGNYLVGDFTFGSALWFRQLPKIQVFFEDGTNVRENMVTIRIEERIAMPVYNKQAFIYPS